MNRSKSELREIFKAKRNQLADEELSESSQKITLAVQEFCDEYPNLEHFHLFFPIQRLKEINTFLIRDFLEQNNKIVYTSVINGISDQMETIQVQPKTEFRKDRYGIPVPKDFNLAPSSFIQVVFVPLLVVDKEGNRIGYGKGYYDRFLASLSPEVVKIGLSVFEPVEQISSEPFDIPLDYCITPKNMFNFSK
jgi:5-formyltetrahydrofolate cyclo-ligase